MYGVSAYYLATVATTVTMFILYPISLTLTSFFFYDFDEHSLGALMDWMFILTLAGLAGGFWGISFGSLFTNEVTAVQLQMFFIILFNLGGGLYANTGDDVNFVVQGITYISPMRYTTELLLNQVLEGKESGEFLLDLLGFTWGNSTCVMLLLNFIFVCFAGGWLILLYKTWYF